jgi:hypothetical protein
MNRLFDRDTNYMEEIVVGNNASLSRYRKEKYPIILIHGYLQNHTNLYPQRTKEGTKHASQFAFMSYLKSTTLYLVANKII